MMQPSHFMTATGVGKCYRRDCSPAGHVANLLFGRQVGHPFWALHPVDIALGPGQALGVVGRNGSGKSTLLQLLAGTLTPTVGHVTHAGRIAGLLELGAGFNPDYTGRENAALNATSLGMSRRDFQDRFPQIAAFADIGDYIDRPVREYSSGMYARLAFAVASHVDADILIVDEILAVGDSLFQKKCHARIRQFRDAGKSIVFVTQNANEMASICTEAIWLDGGNLRLRGPADEVAKAYQSALLGRYQHPAKTGPLPQDTEAPATFDTPMLVDAGPFRPDAPQHGQGGARVVGLHWQTTDGQVARQFKGGAEIELTIRCRAERTLASPIIGFIFRDDRGQNLFGDNSYLVTALNPPAVDAGQDVTASFRFRFPYLPLGRYQLAPSIIEGTQDDHLHLHWMEGAMEITVTQSPVEFGMIGVPISEASLTFLGA
jgi:lipopolysaccharide transport system ATP-binding protein